MVALSKNTTGLIKDDIVSILYDSPRAMFANEIATELRRDKEFIKRLLLELKEKAIVEEINKGMSGREYKERKRWKIREAVRKAFEEY